jgi:hypothetical protein
MLQANGEMAPGILEAGDHETSEKQPVLHCCVSGLDHQITL